MARMGERKTKPRIVLASLLAWPAPLAHAHGFGLRYGLPVPLWLYLTGAGAAVALSFVVMAFFFHRPSALHGYPRVNLLRFPWGRWLAHPALLGALRVVAVALFFLVVAAGWWGAQ